MASHSKRPLAAAVGTAFLASVALAPLASAADNPFQLGYFQKVGSGTTPRLQRIQ